MNESLTAALDVLDDAAHALNHSDTRAERNNLLDATATLRTGIAELEAKLAACQQETTMFKQALSDPENQPSQWGTIPLSRLPACKENPFPNALFPPENSDDWQECGEYFGWNACLSAIAAQEDKP